MSQYIRASLMKFCQSGKEIVPTQETIIPTRMPMLTESTPKKQYVVPQEEENINFYGSKIICTTVTSSSQNFCHLGLVSAYNDL